jgi:hypothetical protein
MPRHCLPPGRATDDEEGFEDKGVTNDLLAELDREREPRHRNLAWDEVYA